MVSNVLFNISYVKIKLWCSTNAIQQQLMYLYNLRLHRISNPRTYQNFKR